MDTWSLDALYKGYDDPCFEKDVDTLKEVIKKLNHMAEQLSRIDEVTTIVNILEVEEQFQELASKLGSFVSLKQAVNTTDSQSVALYEQLEKFTSDATKALSICDKFIMNTTALDTYMKEDSLKEYAFLLTEIKENGKHQLHDEVEEVISKMNQSGGSAWGNLQEYLTSTLVVDYQGEKLTLSAIRNLAYSEDSLVRKQAYEAEMVAYEQIKQPVAFAINNIKSQVNTITKLRHFESPLAMSLHASRMSEETLQVMMNTIEDYLPYFHKYLKQKAKLLGYDTALPWYDLFAPIGSHTKKFTIEEAKTYLVNHFTPFAKDLADMISESFDHNWIDFYPRSGKVGGAFCANLPFIKESRILTNFDGTLSDVITLAHELGHAYHGMMIQNHRPLNTDYPMPLAETASTFNENIILNAAIQEETSEMIKLSLMESQLQDLTQIICDIYSRFLFEKAVFEKRNAQFMFADELSDMMIDAQKKAYGDALDPTTLHPYMWINKSHYYSASLSFYNFPYAFGGLFARGLVANYEKEGSTFIQKYRDMLKATTISTVEDVAALVNVDLKDPAFWKTSLDTCVKSIDEFIELSKNLTNE